MHPWIERFAGLFWPDLGSIPQERRLVGIGDVLSVLFATPIAAYGLVWLLRITDLEVISANWSFVLLLSGLVLLFWRLPFFLIVEAGSDPYASSEGSLAGTIGWIAVFILGPTALWIIVLAEIADFIAKLYRSASRSESWNLLRNFSVNLAGRSAVALLALSLYQRLGGGFPLPNLELPTISIALLALLVNMAGYIFIHSAFLAYHSWLQLAGEKSAGIRPFLSFFFLSVSITQLANPFAILAAGLYAQHGYPGFLFFMVGMLLSAIVARRLSLAAESSRQQSHLLTELEHLGRAIILAPGRQQNLTDILGDHLSHMFPAGNLAIWTMPDRIIHKHPESWDPDLVGINPWLLKQLQVSHYFARDPLPWNEGQHNPLIIAPVLDIEEEKPYGGILLELHSMAGAWDKSSVDRIAAGVQSLAALISSSLHQDRAIAELQEFQRVSQQLEDAARIQASFLDYELPKIPGWQLSVALLPAGQASGDFFDVFPLEDGRIGIIIADVMDKGIGAALYMALSRTLMRTYAFETSGDPELVFFATNQRILDDTNVEMFVTVFYGVLDPASSVLTYCNAGHNPPLLLRAEDKDSVVTRELIRTGIPIGIARETTWQSVSLQLQAGDLLILYTDGIPDSQNSRNELLTVTPMIEAAKSKLGHSAEQVQTTILDVVNEFVGDAPQFDDITLIVLSQETTSASDSSSSSARSHPTSP
jgi:serine phosphatase RsbU (regulator of sigma subunit)